MKIGENLTHCFHRIIHNYGGRGTREDGVHFKESAIVYTSSDPPPLLEAEQISEKFASVRVIPRSPMDRLDTSSRVNYTKLYTIEYNIKMHVVGQIDIDHMERFLNNVRLAHPSLSSKAIIEPKGEFLGEIYSKGSSVDTATSAPQALDTKSISLPLSTVYTSSFASLEKASSQSSIKPRKFTSALDRLTHLLLYDVVLPLKPYFERHPITRAPFERKFRRIMRQASRFLVQVARNTRNHRLRNLLDCGREMQLILYVPIPLYLIRAWHLLRLLLN